eukprot:m.134817 g.134817  ORF g.134817 m.134817 type:complete len:214 (+) comp15828_c1_seq5:808-1449(+)
MHLCLPFQNVTQFMYDIFVSLIISFFFEILFIFGGRGRYRLCFAQPYEAHYKCIPARKAADVALPTRCMTTQDCTKGYSCWNVTLEVDDMYFIRFDVAGKEPVLFLGPPEEFTRSVILSDYVPVGMSSLRFPLVVSTFLGYMVALSPALAILNGAPCWFLDGAFILKALLDLVLPSPKFDEERVAALRRWCLHINTLLLVMLVIVSVLRLVVG